MIATIACRPHRIACNKADIYFVVAKEAAGRFQVVTRDGSLDDYTVIVRCVQGHSGKIQAQMSNVLAHQTVTDASDMPVIVHATKTELLKHIICLNCPGLTPGGNQAKARGHIHTATQLPRAGAAPAGFRMRGVDCVVYLDVKLMLQDGIPNV